MMKKRSKKLKTKKTPNKTHPLQLKPPPAPTKCVIITGHNITTIMLHQDELYGTQGFSYS